jgi:hypothetical protein
MTEYHRMTNLQGVLRILHTMVRYRIVLYHFQYAISNALQHASGTKFVISRVDLTFWCLLHGMFLCWPRI